MEQFIDCKVMILFHSYQLPFRGWYNRFFPFLLSLLTLMAMVFAPCAWSKESQKSTHLMLCNLPHESSTLLSQDKQLNAKVLALAFKAHDCAMQYRVPEKNQRYLSIIDFSLPSSKKRFWVIDLKEQKILYNLYVSHGKGSGFIWSRQFSDAPGSHSSSLGLYLTDSTYQGSHGLSLHLKGLEDHVNRHAYDRSIVIHGAEYATLRFLRLFGHLGRSWGCPAVSPKIIAPLAQKIKSGSLLFVYYPEKRWLAQSKYLHCTTFTSNQLKSKVTTRPRVIAAIDGRFSAKNPSRVLMDE